MRTDADLEVAKLFVHEFFFNYKPPLELLSDNAGCFVSRIFQKVCNLLSVQNLLTKSYHPQNNGQVERYNRTIVS